ncbi:hypothetical protein, unlikely [Trypanosoma congolense IL3000]|uniref:Uncharacterized protein n=1 Tax=Trypanosoma congolense (strain IL3000) TaxID=1068625 RepID=F9W3G2_TRYCI|nr:hypothetical protein, unlikely [Trypanosoma congolense IL3000]
MRMTGGVRDGEGSRCWRIGGLAAVVVVQSHSVLHARSSYLTPTASRYVLIQYLKSSSAVFRATFTACGSCLSEHLCGIFALSCRARGLGKVPRCETRHFLFNVPLVPLKKVFSLVLAARTTAPLEIFRGEYIQWLPKINC